MSPITTGAATQPRLGAFRLALFSSAGIALAGVQIPLTAYLPALYAQHVGLSLTLVGLIFMFSRLWNAVTDPLVGVLSDRIATRYGRRKPWIGAGGVLMLVCGWLIFFPSSDVGPVYLACGLFGLYLGWSMMCTPLYAWSADLSPLYHERTRVQAYLQTAFALGMLLVLLVPAAQDWLGKAVLADKVGAMGWFVIGALLFSVPVLLTLFVERPTPAVTSRFSARSVMRQLLDPLVVRVMASDFAVSLGQGCRGALLLFFITQYMQLPQWMGVLMLVQFGFGVLVAPLWLRISYRFGKQRTLIVAESLQVGLNLCLLLLEPGQVAQLVALTVALGLVQASGNLMLRSIVADVADAQRLKTGEECSGLLYSIFNVTSNAAMALSVGIVLPLVSFFGFAAGGNNSPEVLDRLHWLFALAPATGHLFSALLIVRFPLDEKRQSEIVNALQKRDAQAVEPAGR